MRTFHLLALILPILSAGCAGKGSPPPLAAPPTIETASFAPALGVDVAASTKMASGLYYRDLVAGTGPEVASGQQVSVHYTGWLANGTQFDSNGPSDAPLKFRVGAHEVIDGWDQGVVGMRVGGKRQLIIPATLGYGANDYGPIPGNSILVFTVEVVAVQ